MFSQSFSQLPSPPSSPYHGDMDENEKLNISDDFKRSSIETFMEINQDNCLRNKFMDMIEEGIQINGEITPYGYVLHKLYCIGNKIINKGTKDAVPLRVYEIGKDDFKDFWVHPIYLSLQSFQFFKLFNDINVDNKKGIIEIEVPSLTTFSIILYWLYTGNQDKVLEFGKLDETLCKGIIENIQYLEINIPTKYIY
ncbi:hypothetical protein H8356DRAFT_1366744 [Neocallimastix lanati (nom. inval.)]|uniref:BTB domain-containing protein n=1 Tax=Neocallimastix californiae TaxID=1754190 RepID=A0A1Y2ATU9_9FUNG|nr:hypothetical protein H8356DRAFT_1366744 [Neocallimastix sp. JGI-2020a]ORY25894.1 hypothetical protein LY90DRAFT_629558 [Neocallimastix californiae]|eukprot:ORY25894.1 hypothetical protein LY90DRAFT_629558 [Neocallimastix californiae]